MHSHANGARVADKIIDDVEEATTDVTGKAGALTYENLLDSASDHDPDDTRSVSACLRSHLHAFARVRLFVCDTA